MTRGHLLGNRVTQALGSKIMCSDRPGSDLICAVSGGERREKNGQVAECRVRRIVAMCGRYQLLRPEDIAARFETVNTLPDLAASSDVRPTQSIPVVAMGRELALMKWGMARPWEKERPNSAPLINARAEGIETKVAFRQSLRFQRCIIPATGFYEWQAPVGGGRKVKYLFTR